MLTIKFMPKDVIKGKHAKVGDKFTALFMGEQTRFVIVEHMGSCFMCEFA